MLTLIRNGGVPMLFILAFGLVALGAAFWFAVRADRKIEGFTKNMMLATLFATLGTTCADLGATLFTVEKAFGENEAAGLPRAIHLVVEGFAESTSPGIMGFSFLALTAMVTAVGKRRLDERAEAK